MNMPFGKNKGKPLHEIPTAYLRWMTGLPDLNFALRRAIEAELHWRTQAEPPTPAPAPRHSLLHPGVAAWRSAWPKLVRLAHPDMGGNHELMLALNAVNEEMRKP